MAFFSNDADKQDKNVLYSRILRHVYVHLYYLALHNSYLISWYHEWKKQMFLCLQTQFRSNSIRVCKWAKIVIDVYKNKSC